MRLGLGLGLGLGLEVKKESSYVTFTQLFLFFWVLIIK